MPVERETNYQLEANHTQQHLLGRKEQFLQISDEEKKTFPLIKRAVEGKLMPVFKTILAKQGRATSAPEVGYLQDIIIEELTGAIVRTVLAFGLTAEHFLRKLDGLSSTDTAGQIDEDGYLSLGSAIYSKCLESMDFFVSESDPSYRSLLLQIVTAQITNLYKLIVHEGVHAFHLKYKKGLLEQYFRVQRQLFLDSQNPEQFDWDAYNQLPDEIQANTVADVFSETLTTSRDQFVTLYQELAKVVNLLSQLDIVEVQNQKTELQNKIGMIFYELMKIQQSLDDQGYTELGSTLLAVFDDSENNQTLMTFDDINKKIKDYSNKIADFLEEEK